MFLKQIWIILFFFLIYFLFFTPRHVACGILAPRPGIEPVPPAVEVQSPNHWTTWEFPGLFFFFFGRKECYRFLFSFIEQVLISHQFYTHQCIHVNPNHRIHHTTTLAPPQLPPLGVHTFVLYICVSISGLKTGSSVPFF